VIKIVRNTGGSGGSSGIENHQPISAFPFSGATLPTSYDEFTGNSREFVNGVS
jgi:hypothetical protein